MISPKAPPNPAAGDRSEQRPIRSRDHGAGGACRVAPPDASACSSRARRHRTSDFAVLADGRWPAVTGRGWRAVRRCWNWPSRRAAPCVWRTRSRRSQRTPRVARLAASFATPGAAAWRVAPPAAACQEPLAVAVDHRGGLPTPRLEDRPQLDPRGDHVLRRADSGAVPREPVEHFVGQARTALLKIAMAYVLAQTHLARNRRCRFERRRGWRMPPRRRIG